MPSWGSIPSILQQDNKFVDYVSILHSQLNLTLEDQNMTILGNHIIEGHCYCFSKIEQKYENLHTIFNSLERRFACYKNKSLQYFHCLRAYYNIIRTGPQGPHEMPILPQYYIKLAVQIESNLSHHQLESGNSVVQKTLVIESHHDFSVVIFLLFSIFNSFLMFLVQIIEKVSRCFVDKILVSPAFSYLFTFTNALILIWAREII